MLLARVTGTVTATVKAPGFGGAALLIVEELEDDEPFVALDGVGAGVGDTVLVATGSAARMPPGAAGAPTDMTVVAIVDSFTRSSADD
jgi:ethanolamine utilization protein EutN